MNNDKFRCNQCNKYKIISNNGENYCSQNCYKKYLEYIDEF